MKEIHAAVGDADYSTVYRNVEQLVYDKRIRKVVLDKHNIKYELPKDARGHDHFVCIDCGDTEEVYISREKLSLSNNHTIEDLLIRGLCTNCS